jgi:hypothetical protein
MEVDVSYFSDYFETGINQLLPCFENQHISGQLASEQIKPRPQDISSILLCQFP